MRFIILTLALMILTTSIALGVPPTRCSFTVTIDHGAERAYFEACSQYPYNWDIYYSAPGEPGITYLYTLTDRWQGEVLLVDEGLWLILQVETRDAVAFFYFRNGDSVFVDPPALP